MDLAYLRTDMGDDADADWVDASLPSTPLEPVAGADSLAYPMPEPAVSSTQRRHGDDEGNAEEGNGYAEGWSSAVDAGHEHSAQRAGWAVSDVQPGERDDSPRSADGAGGVGDREEVKASPESGPDSQSTEEEERQCRICFLGAEEEAEMGRLISPCLCSGSMRYCHVKCLNAWRGKGTGSRAFMECPQCHHQYLLRRTLISGLATSRPLLVLSTTVLFALLTLLAGQLVLVLLTSSAPLARLFAPTIDWGDATGTVVITSSTTTLVYDVVSAGLSAAMRVADLFLPDDDEWSPTTAVLVGLGLRAVLGLALLGSLSFVSLLVSLSLFGPLQLANHVRGNFWGWGTTRRRGGALGAGAGAGTDLAQALALVMVLVGVANTLVSVYAVVQGITQSLLRYVETQILEVNPEEAKRARERQRADGWRTKWVREKRWRTARGWREIAVRALAAGRERLRAARAAQ